MFQTIVARKKLAVQTEADKANSADTVMKMLKNCRRKLKADDDCFDVEVGLLHMLCGDTARIRIRDVLSSKMPTADKAIDEATAAQSVRDILAHDGFRFLPQTEQAVVRFCGTLIAAVNNGTTHELKLTSVSESIVQLWQQCKFFCRFEGPLKEGDEISEHTGDAALVATMHKMQQKEKPDDLAKDWERLVKYQFCAKPANAAAVKRVLATRLAAPKAKAKPAYAGPAKRTQAQQDAAEAAAAAYFT